MILLGNANLRVLVNTVKSEELERPISQSPAFAASLLMQHPETAQTAFQ